MLDYDDVHASVRGHPTTVIVPALLAALDPDALPSADAFLAAYLVGLETMAHLGRAIGPAHYERGFHATATLGPLGAAAAIAHLRGFSAGTTAIALGLGATQAAGLRLQFGSDAKPLHAGSPPATDWRRRASPKPACPAPTIASTVRTGSCRPTASAKRRPSGCSKVGAPPGRSSARPDPEGVPVLHGGPSRRGGRPRPPPRGHPRPGAGDDHLPAGGDAALVVRTPRTGIEARFSPEYILAAALVDGAVRIDHFDERPVRPDLAALAARVERRHDQAARRLSSDPSTRFVVVELTDGQGRTHERRIDGLPGLADADDKFRDATAGSEALRTVPDRVRTMHDATDLARLLACLAQPRQP